MSSSPQPDPCIPNRRRSSLVPMLAEVPAFVAAKCAEGYAIDVKLLLLAGDILG